MLFNTVLASAALMGSTYAGVMHKRAYEIPNNDGFPTPSDSQLQDLSLQAGGKLPGGPLPNNLGPGSQTAFQLIAFNELFETAFFSSLLYNVTEGVSGYETDAKYSVTKVLKTVLAQEELHALAAIASLKASNAWYPEPCKYKFPVATLQDAISLAETFTAIVLGALQDANVIFSKEGQPEVVRIISSVIGQEGEQNGAYRTFLQEIPSESPFLTTVPAAFAWSALQNFVVPGSCPFDLSKIDLPIFPGILVNGALAATIPPADTTLTFTADLSGYSNAHEYVGKTDLFLTYTTGQQIPYSVDIEDVKWDGEVISFSAPFPYTTLVAGGFTHAALTTGNSFANADAVVDCTVAGPGVIQVVDSVKQS